MTSYGGLIPGQSEEDFFSCSSMPRNRELMRVFKDLGFVEQLGSGMSRILKIYDKSIYNISDHYIKVTFAFDDNATRNATLNGINKATHKSEISSDEILILDAINYYPTATQEDISRITGTSVGTVKRIMPKLQKEGVIEREGSKKTGKWIIL